MVVYFLIISWTRSSFVYLFIWISDGFPFNNFGLNELLLSLRSLFSVLQQAQFFLNIVVAISFVVYLWFYLRPFQLLKVLKQNLRFYFYKDNSCLYIILSEVKITNIVNKELEAQVLLNTNVPKPRIGIGWFLSFFIF